MRTEFRSVDVRNVETKPVENFYKSSFEPKPMKVARNQDLKHSKE